MKKILVSSTLVTALIAGAILLPRQAVATSAKERFASMRLAFAKAFSDGELTVSGTLVGDGSASFNVLLDGSPLPPDIPVSVTGEKHVGYTNYTVKIDFSDTNFSSIAFGRDHDTLELTPKASPNLVDIVNLDPKTGRPLTWTEYREGSPKPVAAITYKKSSSSAASSQSQKFGSVPSDGVVTAHIRFVTQ